VDTRDSASGCCDGGVFCDYLENAMKNCTDCKYADWQRTAAGKLHPSGNGRCAHPWQIPPLPAAFYFLTRPIPTGGSINRREEFKEHCPCYEAKK